MGTLVNTSAISSPCLMINTSNVTLNCNNFKISNGTIGIEEKSASNITLENCNIYNFHTGVLLSGISNSSILNLNVNYGGTQNEFIPGQSGGIVGIDINKMLFSNITVKNSITGMILENSANSTLQNINIFNNIIGGLMLESANFDLVSNLIANYNKYGISMQNTFATTIKGFEFKNNTYGTYLSESFGNVFLNGYAMNNSDGDIYATPDSANTSDNQIIKTTCGLTDAYWAQRYCQAFVVPGLNYKPVINCTSITRPGIYKLTTDLNKVTASCMYIKSNNVVFDCGSHKIFGNGYGTAITANGDNITISFVIVPSTSGITITIDNKNKIAQYIRYKYPKYVRTFDVPLEDNDINLINEKVKNAIKEKKEEYLDSIISLIEDHLYNIDTLLMNISDKDSF